MGKRVYKLAKELNITKERILEIIKNLGLNIKGYLGSITDEDEKKIIDALKKPEETKEEIVPIEEPPEEEILEIYVAPQQSVTKKKKRKEKRKIDEKEIEKRIKETKAKIEGRKKRYRKKKFADNIEIDEEKLKIPASLTVRELAGVLEIEPNTLILKCLELGLPVTINQRLDFETISLLAEDYGLKVELYEEFEKEISVQEYCNYKEKPPVITVMGHVDHGKTTLLEYIQNINLTAFEKGKITQKIGAYHVEYNKKIITFIDLPGHKAFTQMRARGAKVADIVILVVAANEGVKEQTIEAINHAKSAGVPIIVAINKIDMPTANPLMVRQQLADHKLLVQEYGGDIIAVDISAKTGEGIDDLLESILLVAEHQNLKAPFDGPGEGYVIEAKKEQGFGNICTAVVRKGKFKVGDAVIAGTCFGKIKRMVDERNKFYNEATPGLAVKICSFEELPQAGELIQTIIDEKKAREIAEKRTQVQRMESLVRKKKVSLEKLQEELKSGAFKELNVIVKGGDMGAVDAISDSFMELKTDEIKVNIIHKGVGEINENDVLLASASDSIIIGYRAKPNAKTKEIAKAEGVEIRCYDIIYDAIDDVRKALSGMLEPEYIEKTIGKVKVKTIFKIPKVGVIAGSYVSSGKIVRGYKCRIIRNGEVICESIVSSLKRFKDDVKEVQEGFECGVGIDNFEGFKEDDIIEIIEITEKGREL